MKFEIKQAIVEFKSNNEFYRIEESGDKPNTVRELTPDEIKQASNATHVRIVDSINKCSFERKLTNVCVVPDNIIPLHCKDIRQLVIFSWEHPPTQTKKPIREFIDKEYKFKEPIERCG